MQSLFGALTSRNKEAIEGSPIIGGKEISCGYVFRPWIHRLQYQTQQHAEERHEVRDGFEDLL